MFQSKYNNKSYTIDDFFDSYKEYTDGNKAYNISRKLYRDLVTDYFTYISDEVIDRSVEFRLPARMGSLYVFKKKPIKYNFTYLRVDFKATKDMNKTILHLNEHSDGYNYRFRWSKKDMMLKNSSLYELVMTRKNKRRLANAIKNEGKDYIEIK